MFELEGELQGLAAAIEWPPTPQMRISLAPAVVVTLPARREARFPRWALAAAAALLIVATLLAYTPTRDVIAGWLNLHTTIQRVQHPPTPSPLPPGQLGENLGLGSATTLDGAQAQVSWKIAVPSSLGRPDAVYVKLPPQGPTKGEVTLVYAERQGIKVSGQTGVAVLVTEARGQVDEIYFRKTLGPDNTLEQVTVNGHPGYWISGHPHEFAFNDASGGFYAEPLRLATNTLLFDDKGTLVRIEADMTKAQAIEIGKSM